MTSVVYHGTTTWKMHSLMKCGGDFWKRFPGLFVTDTQDRASRYANAQASHYENISHEFLPLRACAVICVIETEDEIKWIRRPTSHPSLDHCETIIQHGKIVEMFIRKPVYHNSDQHERIAQIQAIATFPVHLLES